MLHVLYSKNIALYRKITEWRTCRHSFIEKNDNSTIVPKHLCFERDTGMGVRRGCQGDLIPLDFEIWYFPIIFL